MPKVGEIAMKRVCALLLAVLLVLPAWALGSTASPYTARLEARYVDDGVDVYAYFSGAASYNAFQLVFSYDSSVLQFLSAEEPLSGDTRQLQSKANANGTLTVSGCGETLSCGQDAAVVLHFKANKTGTTQLYLARAYVSERSTVRQDAAPAAIQDGGVVTVTTGVYTVTLPSDLGLTGDRAVTAGSSYTFRGSPYYDYRLSATVNGQPAQVKDNGGGSFTVESVTGPLVITGSRSGKTHSVAVVGSGKADVTASDTAAYGADYTFTINRAALAEYAVSVTVDGGAVSVTNVGDVYTVSGDKLTGNVIISVAKAARSGTTLVLFSGSGAADVFGGGAELTAENNSDLTVPMSTMEDGYTYTVTVDGETLAIDDANCFTIPARLMTGAILAVTVTKTVKLDITIGIFNYAAAGTDRAWLILAVPTGLTADKTLAYNGTSMLYSTDHNAFAIVVESASQPSEATVRSLLTMTASRTAVTSNGDVNASGRVDINDAQLTYDMYRGLHTVSELTQTMWLRADVNGDKTVNVQDVQAILNTLSA